MECSGKRSQSADDDVVQNTFEHLSKKWKQDEIASDVGKCMVTGRITLIWSRKQIKDEIYQKYRLWPSFVGARNSQDIHGPGVPPVRLWPAQQHYIRSVQLSNPSFELETNSMNKGKRESPFDVYSDRSESSVLVKLLQNHLTVARSLVFKDLMDRGYLVGPGDVYGGDYTIYNDDPSQEHAMATIRVVGSKQWKYLDGSVDGHYLDINEFEDPKRCNAAYECSEQKGTVEETAPALECAPTTLNCSVDTSETTISSAAASTNAEDSTAHRLSDTVISCREFLAFARVQNQVAKLAVLSFPIPQGASAPSDVGYLTFKFDKAACKF